MSDGREVWITGVGLITCLGEGLEVAWGHFERGDPPPYDDKSFAPYIVHPLCPVNFDKQIPKKSDQRQMELWQRMGVYAAGLALADAGLVGKPELLDNTDMIVAAAGGERDISADAASLTGMRKVTERGPFLNERLMSDLRPTLFLAQLPNLLAGNISIVHGVVGSSRTFLRRRVGRHRRVRIAQARIAAGQSELTLVGGAYNATRWDVLLIFEQSGQHAGGSLCTGLGSRSAGRHRARQYGRLPGAGKLRACAGARRAGARSPVGGLRRPQSPPARRDRSDAA